MLMSVLYLEFRSRASRPRCSETQLSQGTAPSRRFTSRVEASGEVWVYWKCNGRDDVSRVRDMSWGGLFLETEKPRAPGIKANLHFLVQEGQIRAEGVVQRAVPGIGLGLKLLSVSEKDRSQLAALMTRLRRLSQLPGVRNQPFPRAS
jgi:hypothetical protein